MHPVFIILESDRDVSVPLVAVSYNDCSFMDNANNILYNEIIKRKRLIGIDPFVKNWEKMKKRTNPYELIHTTHNNKNMSIADHSPLSRSYFKMWEMIVRYKLLNHYDKSIITAHLAEGPGGFVEATRYYRRNYMDYMYAITLRSTCGDVPGWSSSVKFLKRHRNIEVSYGSDGTGDLYKINNILHFGNTVGFGHANFVTADGGFDFSVDFNNQERMFYRLFYCEVVTALTVQAKGGTFVCKVFDIFHRFTFEILYLLYTLYDELIIDKPLTSRPANSEKYIIARGFRGINVVYLKQLQDIVLHWNDSITSILEHPIPVSFIDDVTTYNQMFNEQQISTIERTLQYIRVKYSPEELEEIRRKQCINAVEWCKAYGQRINRKCYVLKKFYNWRLLRCPQPSSPIRKK